jgi:ABC-type uncharacterized transport system fused permease/ATPase subunit
MEAKFLFPETETSVYDIVNKYDFLLVPMANSVAGAAGFGLSGALVGVAAGIIDEVLVSYGGVNNRYLSPVIQGASSFATLTTSWAIRGVGGVLSLIFSQLAISEYGKYVDKMTIPTQIALQGGYMFGWKGILVGTVLASVEEVFIYYKVYDKHYISTAISFASITHLLKEKTGVLISYYVKDSFKLSMGFTSLKQLEQKLPYFLESIAGIISSVKSFYEKDVGNVITILELQKDIREIYKKLGVEVEYLDILEKQVLTTSGFMVAEQFLYFRLIGSVQKQMEGFYGQLTNNGIWNNFKIASYGIFITLPGVVVIQQAFIAPIESYFSFSSQNLLYEAVSKKWLIGEIPLKILQQEDTEVLIDNLNKDITTIADSGEGLRKSFFNGIAQSIYSQYLMYQYNAQDLIVIYQIYYGCTQYISEYLSKWKISYNNEIRTLETKKNTIIKHDARNVKLVVERNGFEYSEYILKEVNNKIKITTTKQLMITHLYNTWKDVEKYTDSMVTAFSIGYKTHIGEIGLNVQLKLWVAADSISSLMRWKGKNAGTVEEVRNSIEKLHSFIDKINDIEGAKDQRLQQVENIGEEMIFEDLCITTGDTELLYTKRIVLEAGKYYALSGESGSGKSSLLSKIKGITYNGVTASGKIKYPNGLDQIKDIVLMSQSDFFPLDVTLLEAIYYPKLISSDQKKQIYSKVFNMLERLELCSGNDEAKNTCSIEEFINTQMDWSSVLSGGQKKKVLLVSALIQEAKVLLLDEPFTGLHQEAILEVQSFIKENLKHTNTLVICIDHHVSDSINFYDFELHIKNKTLELKKFSSTTNDVLLEKEYSYQDEQYFKGYTNFDANYNTYYQLFTDTCALDENT